MVATVASAAVNPLMGVAAPATAVGAPTNVPTTAQVNGQTNGQAGADVDATLFAQLMQGLTEPVVAAAPVLPANTEAPTVKDEALVNDSDISAELLALSAVPMVIALPPVPALIASDTQPVSLPAAPANVQTQLPPLLLAQTPADEGSATPSIAESRTLTPPPSTADALNTPADTTLSNTSKSIDVPLDVQWLRAMSGANQGKPTSAAADRSVNASSQMADLATASVDSSKAKSVTDQPATTPQNLLQLLAANTAVPTLINAPRDAQQKIEIDLDKTVGNDATGVPVLNQPVGTALAEASRGEAPARLQLHNTVGSHQWATELGNKLTLLAARDTQSATLYMTPADLGPVQVRIDMNQDQASVWFTAEHADTRTALEQALPRLRELFTAQGMSLTDAGVFGNRSHAQQQQPQSFASNSTPLGNFASDDALADTAMVRSISLGMLDAYA